MRQREMTFDQIGDAVSYAARCGLTRVAWMSPPVTFDGFHLPHDLGGISVGDEEWEELSWNPLDRRIISIDAAVDSADPAASPRPPWHDVLMWHASYLIDEEIYDRRHRLLDNISAASDECGRRLPGSSEFVRSFLWSAVGALKEAAKDHGAPLAARHEALKKIQEIGYRKHESDGSVLRTEIDEAEAAWRLRRGGEHG